MIIKIKIKIKVEKKRKRNKLNKYTNIKTIF